jgi:hypothetical protein
MSHFCNTNTINNHDDNANKNKNKEKKVRFDSFHDIYFIPSITELKKNSKLNDIWWTSNEMNFFRKSFMYSVHIFVQCNPHIDYKVAVKELLDRGK